MKTSTPFWSLSLLALGAAFLGGCGTATNSGYTTTYDQYGQPVYTSSDAYGRQVDAYGRPVYTNATPVYGQQVDPYGRPISPSGVNSYGQPVDAYGRPVMVQQTYGDDYIYYPDSEVYYSPARRDYVYVDGGRWAHHRTPPRAWNQSSVSVHLNFGDGDPWAHHNDVVRRYPHNWRDRDRNWDRDRDGDRGWDRR